MSLPLAGHGDRPIIQPDNKTVSAVLGESREIGATSPGSDVARGQVKALPFAKSWVHLMAGGYVIITILHSRDLTRMMLNACLLGTWIDTANKR